MSDEDMLNTPEQPPLTPLTTENMNRIVELAREALRERGYSEEQIEALLHRRRVNEQPPERRN